jgi:hypothetical protein
LKGRIQLKILQVGVFGVLTVGVRREAELSLPPVSASFLSGLLFYLQMEKICSSETSAVSELHGIATQKTVLIVLSVDSNIAYSF